MEALPDGWSLTEHVADECVVGMLRLRRAGLAAVGHGGEQAIGACAELDGDPAARARYELLERIVTLEAAAAAGRTVVTRARSGEPQGEISLAAVFPADASDGRSRSSRSNGVALHADWDRAACAALWELAERDRVLRSWRGEIAPRALDLSIEGTPLEALTQLDTHDWLLVEFPEPRSASFSRGVAVVGVFGIPTSEAPFVLGFGARPDVRSALAAAGREALQQLAFLWGEELPAAPPPQGATATHHVEHYQYRGHQDVVRRWLERGHGAFAPREPPLVSESEERVIFADLTPTWLGGGLRVARALCSAAVPLVFGESATVASLPTELRVHPIG